VDSGKRQTGASFGGHSNRTARDSGKRKGCVCFGRKPRGPDLPRYQG
jgi:hypothetical protein